LLEPLAHEALDRDAGAGEMLVVGCPATGHVVEGAEVGVDRELVAVVVVAGGLVLEIPNRAGAIANGDPGDIRQLEPQILLRVVRAMRA
jgi:hypothetical protein